jgi:hypothetical protein
MANVLVGVGGALSAWGIVALRRCAINLDYHHQHRLIFSVSEVDPPCPAI